MALMTAAYENVSKTAAKPTYAVQAMHPGTGKSRLLTEWVYHALNDTEILKSFLNCNAPLEEKARKQFINAMYETAFTQRIILHPEEADEKILTPTESKSDLKIYIRSILIKSLEIKSMIRESIRERFKNVTISFDGADLTIDHSFEEKFGKGRDTVEHMQLFNSLVDTFCAKPDQLPFDDLEPCQQKLFIFGIDECQVISLFVFCDIS